MALEPITRQEKIISGENLKPITRMEMFLKEFGGGGSGGSGGGVSPEEVTTIVKEQFPGGVGYDEVQTINEPLNITWDGNTEGLVRAEGEMPLFKVSDVVLTDEQVKLVNVTLADFTYSMADEWDTLVENDFVTEDIVMPEGVAFVRKDGAEHMGMMFPEAGIYAFSGGAYVHAITTTEPIEQTKVVTKKLDAKYLPNTGGGVLVVEVDWDTNKVITPLNDIRDAWLNHTPVVLYENWHSTDVYAYYLSNASVRGDNGNFWGATFFRMEQGGIRFYNIYEDGIVEYNSLNIEMTEGR